MTSLFMKVIICPLVVTLSAYILPNVNFTNMFQPILIGLTLAIAGTLMEYLFLREGSVWTSTFLDFIAATIIVYVFPIWMDGAVVTFLGAIVVALFLAVTEHFSHIYLVKTNKTQKSFL
ncbi:DUF2512 family protein [Bacillus pinisoli]|uniref:DUF2512 family protein n=1 Tax=Bacillus pinisoli TaxID=2901866 RepID=UPI001FF456EF|nr:DUF2512 family protein [Bacillus pinisoli]